MGSSGSSVSGIQAKKIIGYAMLPEVIPRVKRLIAHGFGQVAFLMACVYSMVRLLPPGHPYLDSRNIGRFGIRHVIAEAANRLVLSRRNIDQIVIFAAILMAVIILCLQFLLLAYVLILRPFMGHAMATSLFSTPDPQDANGTVTDIAFLMLDQVFGIPGLFCTAGNKCTNVMPGGQPLPFHVALHSMLQFYSMGLLLIGVLIFLYFIVVVVAETATSGSPFGQRFKSGWTPIRLVVALGLLIPLNYGLNSAQYITLYAAKMGSGFATRTWIVFNNTVASGKAGATVFSNGGANPLGERKSLVAKPNAPDISSLVAFMGLVHACEYAHYRSNGATTENSTSSIPPSSYPIKAYLVKNDQTNLKDHRQYVEVPAMNSTTNSDTDVAAYVDALKFYDQHDITIRFGIYDATQYKAEPGNVQNTCGEVLIKINDHQNATHDMNIGGGDYMQDFYFNLVRRMWSDPGDGGKVGPLKTLSYCFVESAFADKPSDNLLQCNSSGADPAETEQESAETEEEQNGNVEVPKAVVKQDIVNVYQPLVNSAVNTAWDSYNKNGVDIKMTPAIMDRGWGGAGIWYNLIAEVNGAFSDAVSDFPQPVSAAYVMERVKEEVAKENVNVTADKQFVPNLAHSLKIQIDGVKDAEKQALVLSSYLKWWVKDGTNQADKKAMTGDGFRDFIESFFGAQGLFQMMGPNSHIHPLAQLSSLGKALINSAIFSLGASTLSSALGGFVGAFSQYGAAWVGLVTSIYSSVGTMALISGLILFYVLPFLPFIYFFFAVGEWVMSIFEAMVGAPLWALAHLQLDGEGLPGESASNGYFLIFEIFLRPILIVFGLVASILIFSAQVRILNSIWTIVLGNLTGAPLDLSHQTAASSTPRDVIDQFCFSLMYVMITYIMATSSFKLIDRIPEGILRFMGTGAASFVDINQDEGIIQSMTQYVAFGSQQAIGTLASGADSAAGGIGGAAGQAVADSLRNTPPPPGGAP